MNEEDPNELDFLCVLYIELRPTLIQHAHRAFPHLCPALAEDAIQDLFVGLLARSRRGHALPATLDRDIRKFTWRAMRNQWRTSRRRREASKPVGWEPKGNQDPHEHAEFAELLRVLPELLHQAAKRFGGRNAVSLRAALNERASSDATECAIAQRFGVRRENINRAMRWLRETLGLRAQAGPRSRCTPRRRT